MLSLTTALPSWLTVIVSSKLEMRHDLAKSGVDSRQRQKANAATRAARRVELEHLFIASKLYGNRFAVGFGGLEELALCEPEHARENVGWK